VSIETISVNSDQWGLLVSGRLQSCNDLVAEEARYHRSFLPTGLPRSGNLPVLFLLGHLIVK